MSLKNFVSNRSEKIEILSQIKDIILKQSDKQLQTLKKLNISKFDEVLQIFLNIGNMSYISGDIVLFEFFIKSLFELMHAESEALDKDELMKYIQNYGLKSVKDHDIAQFSIILNNLKEYTFELKGTKNINSYLRILKNLALKSESHNYELGTFEVLSVFNELNGYFKDKKMDINRFYLHNNLISLMSSAEINHHERLKYRILKDFDEIFGLEASLVLHNKVNTELHQSIEDVDTSSVKVV